MQNSEGNCLTFGPVMFPGGPPPDARLVLIQVKESKQSFLLPLQFGHLSTSLHGAHTPLHYRDWRHTLYIQIQVAGPLHYHDIGFYPREPVKYSAYIM